MARPRPVPPARVEPWNASNRWARAFSGEARPGVGHLDHHDRALAPAGDADLVAAGIVGARAAFQRLQRIARQVEQDAEQLVVIGLDHEAALDRADPADRRIRAEPERLVHLLDQRLEQDRPAVRRRLLHAAVGQRRLAEGDGALERVHQLRREALHAGIGQLAPAGRRTAAPTASRLRRS